MATVDRIFTLLEKQVAGGNNEKLHSAQDLFKALSPEMKHLSDGARLAVSATSSITDSLLGLSSKAFSATSAMRLLPLEIAKLAVALTQVGIAAAQARREQHIQARAQGTTVQGADSLANFFRIFKLGDAKAREMANASAGAVNGILKSAKSGDKDALKKLNLAEVDGFDKKTGKMRNTAQVAAEAIQKGEGFRALADAADVKGDKAQATKYRDKADAAYAIAGLSDVDRERIAAAQIPPEQIADRFQEERRKTPPLTAEEEARFQRVADQWAKISGNFEAIGNGATRVLNNLGATLADAVLPKLDSFSAGLVKFAKWLGIIGDTPEEAAARKKEEAEWDKIRSEAVSAGVEGRKKFEEGVRNGTIYDRDTSESQQVTPSYRIVGDGVEYDSTADEKDVGISNTTLSLKTAPDLSSIDIALRNMSQLTGQTQMGLQATTFVQAADQQAAYNNVGNDQRQMPMTFNTYVTANTPSEIVGGVQQGVSNAVATVKENNGSTASKV